MSGPSRAALQRWLVGQIAAAIELPTDAVDPRASFQDLGLSSRMLVSLHGALEEHLGRPLPQTVLWQQGTPAAVAQYLTEGRPAPAAREDGPVDPGEPIAIVGIGLRLPGGADSPDAFWQLLADRVDAVGEVPAARWRLDPDAVRAAGADPADVRWAALLEGIEQFDARFFGISPREAEAMDPQQRLLLEVAWQAVEHAAVPLPRLQAGRTGVFVGIANSDYGRLQELDGAGIGAYTNAGSALSIAANRLSYAFDLRGPSLAVDTACSSSLVALHLAGQSLRTGECDAALVGGVNAVLSPTVGLNYGIFGGISATGRCRPFDAGADGIVRGEGAVVVLLERLGDALRHGDPVIAVVRGSAVTSDGRTNGLTAPSPDAQAEAVRAAWRAAGVTGERVGLVETHGPGTPLGDPIEVAALAEVYGEAAGRCALGSVKGNLGHLEAAAGLAGLVKAALAVQRGVVPANLHFERPNPRIPFEGSPFFVPTAPADWPVPAGPRVAAVSSFGFGGTNAHAVLEQAPAVADRDEPERPAGPHVLVASARTPDALAEAARRLADAVEQEASVADVCATAARRRTHLEHRVGVVAADRDRLADGLRAFAAGRAPAGVLTGHRPGVAPTVAWCFSGFSGALGSAGRELLAVPGPFRDAVDEVAPLLGRDGCFDVRDALNDPGRYRADDPAVALPTSFADQVGLAAWWRGHGLEPDVVIGHSAGEVAAAYVAGALDLADAVRVACARARLLKGLVGTGAMASVELPLEEVRAELAAHPAVGVAVDAAPGQVVLSGPAAELDALVAAWMERGVRCRPVAGSVPGHSAAVEPLLPELAAALDGIEPRRPAVPMLSTVDPGVRDRVPDAAYWQRNLRGTVHFRAAVERLAADGTGAFLELGPHPVLAWSIDRTVPGATVLAPVRRDESPLPALVESLTRLHCLGADVDWSGRYPGGEVVPLPAYPWQHRPYWYTAVARRPEPVIPEPVAPEPVAPEPVAGPARGLRHRLEWHPVAPAPAGPGGRDWLLLAGTGGLGPQLALELARRGQRCTLVEPGEWTPERARLTGAWSVVDLRATDEPGTDLATVAEHRVEAAAAVLTDLLAAGSDARLWWVTRRTQPIGEPGKPLDVTGAPLWGLGRTLRHEQPERWGGLIDVDGTDGRVLAARIADEIASGATEPEVAYRGRRRFAARLGPAPDEPGTLQPADPDGSYLICGGHGHVGPALAQWLAGRGARHLVLTGRTGRDPGVALPGVEIVTVAADVTDEAAMAALFDRFGHDLPPLREVYQLATSRGVGRVAATRPEDGRARLAAKVRGSLVLQRLCAGRDVERLVLFSSVAGVLGWRGGGHYAAANAFQDALAQQQHRLGAPVVSVAWGVWDLPDPIGVELVRDGHRPMPPDAALAELAAVLAAGVGHAVVSAMDGSGPAPAPQPRPEPAAAAGVDELRRMLRAELAAVLRVDDPDEIDPGIGLFELGLDSVMSVELRRRIERRLGRDLAPTLVFEHPTLEELAVALAAGQGGAAEPAPPPGPDGAEDLIQRLAETLDRLR